MNSKTYNWNTYSGVGFNRLIKLPEKYELRIAVFIPEKNLYSSLFYFSEQGGEDGGIVRIKTHSPYGEYTNKQLSFKEYTFEMKTASFNEGDLVCQLKPLAGMHLDVLILLEIEKIWEPGEVKLTGETISFPLKEGVNLKIKAKQDTCSAQQRKGVFTGGVYAHEDDLIKDLQEKQELNGKSGKGKLCVLSFNGKTSLKILVKRDNSKINFEDVENILETSRREYGKNSPVTTGSFETAMETINTVMNSQIVWDELHGLFYTSITRAWVNYYLLKAGIDREIKGPLLGLWDNLFNALLHTFQNREAIEGNLKVLFDDSVVMKEGYPPNYVVSMLKSGDRSQPPLGSFIAWKIFLQMRDYDLLRYLYPRLKKWHHWWMAKRDGNRDGLLEWGSNAEPLGTDAGTLFGAKCESGMDNSPLFDDAHFVEEKGVMNLSSIDLNSIFAADCLYLSKIAKVLGKNEESKIHREEYEKMKEKINQELWNKDEGIYLNKYWNGSFSNRLAPTSFYSLFAMLSSVEQAEIMINKYLLNEKEFWGEFVIPSISKQDKAFSDQLYWRGRIWPPINYLVYVGLKKYGFDDIAAEFVRKSYQLFMREWKEKGHCHENYNALSGEGCDVPSMQVACDEGFMGSTGSDRFYTWGVLLLLPGIEEMIAAEENGGLRFGSMYLEEESTIDRLKICDAAYKVTTSKTSLEVFRNGKRIIFAEPGVNIINYEMREQTSSFKIKGRGTTLLRINEFKPFEKLRVIVGEVEKMACTSDKSGIASFKINLEEKYTGVLIKRVGGKL